MRWVFAKHTVHAKTAKGERRDNCEHTSACQNYSQDTGQGDIWPRSQRVTHRSSMLASTAPHNDSKQAS
eukprot:10749467-Alexandrium_andersonii.AAC.1